jgi:hypothetical protein
MPRVATQGMGSTGEVFSLGAFLSTPSVAHLFSE